ncbi:N-formylglutamate amidohydrolase [Solidesulfovibrio carbinoliphilus subsp. oakridgensis]|uniref:N-formylglutamate amidohydrolase n=1 Tax=Solidesulfovibrio carbinoliphilus subsp. oakridgensis TaxID=694327 RepID=G7QDM9_9BACT|nr:N-formylglutamate amidohydrolase [Solidesulfovibrio carbinoliphilus]EHJ46535.1 N-formylglutamate amidohydrolase [Solidesulfovibrio carbinoliphilus subsp. oakridgensis]
MSASPALLITCEHGGNDVPPPYARLFTPWRDLLASHRGFDAGALETARGFATATGAPLFASTTTRLVVDLNRSVGRPGLFSEITRPLPARMREAILAAHYHPHRQAVAAAVADLLESGRPVLHIASHSFTPCLAGVTRHCDAGFLYDPKRSAERDFCGKWMQELACLDPDLILRRNSPYRGVADGLATALRRRFGERYLGIELEVSQRFALAGPEALSSVNEHLVLALLRALGRDTPCRAP